MSARASETDEPTLPFATNVFYGNGGTEAALLAAYRSQRVPHAFLLIGQKGIGKATLAYRFARFVLAHPDPAAPEVQAAASLAVDPAHPVAHRMAARAQGDLLVLERTPNEKGVLRQQIAVDDIRRTISFFGSTAGEGGWRIAIVDAVDELNRFGANALLKVLGGTAGAHNLAAGLSLRRAGVADIAVALLRHDDAAVGAELMSRRRSPLPLANRRAIRKSGSNRRCRWQRRARFNLPRRGRLGAAPAGARRTRSLACPQRRGPARAGRRARRRRSAAARDFRRHGQCLAVAASAWRQGRPGRVSRSWPEPGSGSIRRRRMPPSTIWSESRWFSVPSACLRRPRAVDTYPLRHGRARPGHPRL